MTRELIPKQFIVISLSLTSPILIVTTMALGVIYKVSCELKIDNAFNF